MSVIFIYKMASVSVLCLAKSFSALNIHSSPWNISLRFISRRGLFEKLQIPEKPKRPMGVFFAFANDKREEVSRKNPDLTLTELAKRLGQMWTELSKEEKQMYKIRYAEQFIKYKEALKTFENSITDEQMTEINQAVTEVTALKEKNLLKKMRYIKIKEFNKPKAPLNAFARFVKSNDRGNKKMTEFWKEMGVKWKSLPNEEKEKYLVEYEKEKIEFTQKLNAWEKEMAEKGNFDIIRSRTLRNKLKKFNIRTMIPT